MNNNGNILQQQFSGLCGLRVRFVKLIESPQLNTYFFDLLNINDYNKNKIEKIIEKLSLYNHRQLVFQETLESNFAVCEPLAQRQPLFLTSFNFEVNNTFNISIPIGKDLYNNVVEIDFDKIPHILIAGTTGSGKSVLLNTMICSLLAKNHSDNFDLTLIDPKGVEFDIYRPLKNAKFIDSTNEAVAYLNELCIEMDMRYKALQEKGFKDYHGHLKPKFIVIDELADLMLTSRYEIEESLVRLAQKSRAIGFHLIVATQRPTTNICTGLIKANLPCKIGLKVSSVRDSVVVMDKKGLEKLLGFGDAIIKVPYSTEETRFQCAYVSQDKIKKLVETKNQ